MKELELLDLVTTISEAVDRWFYSETTIRRWISEGKIKARQAAGIWLIDVPSLVMHLAESREHGEREEVCLNVA